MTHQQDHRYSLPRRIAIAACLATGLFFAFRAASPHASAVNAGSSRSIPGPPIADQTEASESALVTQNIEDIRLGQRVVGTNPLREQTQSATVINPQNWRAVSLRMNQQGVTYDLKFLRPVSWLEAAEADVGEFIHMELHEMGLNGPAEVVAIDPCPNIEPDDGTGRNVVTGTMAHPAANILHLDITGLDEPLGVTDTHPIWSETRHDFIKAGQLEIGEQFRTLTGESATLTAIHPHRGPPEIVFNLEVDAEHVYSVAGNGLLVHNDCVTILHATSEASAQNIVRNGVDREFFTHVLEKADRSELDDLLGTWAARNEGPHSLLIGKVPAEVVERIGVTRSVPGMTVNTPETIFRSGALNELNGVVEWTMNPIFR